VKGFTGVVYSSINRQSVELYIPWKRVARQLSLNSSSFVGAAAFFCDLGFTSALIELREDLADTERDGFSE